MVDFKGLYKTYKRNVQSYPEDSSKPICYDLLSTFYLETYGVPIKTLFLKALKNFEGFALVYFTKVTLRSEGQSIEFTLWYFAKSLKFEGGTPL
jgi:hypothetical protein